MKKKKLPQIKIKNKEVMDYLKDQQERIAIVVEKTRKKRGLSQMDLAVYSGTSPKCISKIECKKSDATVWTLAKVGCFLKISFCEMFFDGEKR